MMKPQTQIHLAPCFCRPNITDHEMTFNDHDAPGAFALEFSADQSRLLHPLRRQHNLDEYGETYLFQKSWNKKIVTI